MTGTVRRGGSGRADRVIAEPADGGGARSSGTERSPHWVARLLASVAYVLALPPLFMLMLLKQAGAPLARACSRRLALTYGASGSGASRLHHAPGGDAAADEESRAHRGFEVHDYDGAHTDVLYYHPAVGRGAAAGAASPFSRAGSSRALSASEPAVAATTTTRPSESEAPWPWRGGGRPTVFIVIPGNPGAASFYDAFARELFRLSGRRAPVVCLGHANHSVQAVAAAAAAAAASATPSAAAPRRTSAGASDGAGSARGGSGGGGGSTAKYNLEQQVALKVEAVRHVLARCGPGAQAVLIGHSIGAHMVLEVMRALPSEAVLRGVLLFPTVMHMGDTPNGRRLMPLFRFGRWAVAALAAVVGALPASLQLKLASIAVPGEPAHTDHAALHAAEALLHPTVARNALWMALHEVREVQALDEEVIAEHGHKLCAYFSPTDEWAPMWQYEFVGERIRARGGTVHLCREGVQHAFVLGRSKTVAERVWGWVGADVSAHL